MSDIKAYSYHDSLRQHLIILQGAIGYALKSNIVAALFLQVIAVFIGLCYFYWPPARPIFSSIAQLKVEYGISYAVLATAIFGGIIPYCYLFLSGKLGPQVIKQFIFYCLLWAAMGGIIDTFYGLQAYLFGDDTRWLTVVKKTAFDQFVFSAFLTCPLLTILYMWKDNGFSCITARAQFKAATLFIKITTTVVTNWLIWIPSVSLIYMMPIALQLPLFNLVLCLFVLVLSALQHEERKSL